MPAKLRWFSSVFGDLRHHPKHCGSLVVQTGFPTSLVDVFFKNQDRIKNPSKCKKSKKSATPPAATTTRTKQQGFGISRPVSSRPFIVAAVASQSSVPPCRGSGIADLDSASEIRVSACRRSETVAADTSESRASACRESQSRFPACRQSEIAFMASGISSPESRGSEIAPLASEIGAPSCRGSEIASVASEIRFPACRDSNGEGKYSVRRLLQTVMAVSMIAVFVLAGKGTVIGIAITALSLPFPPLSHRLLPSFRRLVFTLRRFLFRVIGNPALEERSDDVLAPVEEIDEIEETKLSETIAVVNSVEEYSMHQEDCIQMTERRRRGLKSKLKKLVRRKLRKSEKVKESRDQESIDECKRNAEEEEEAAQDEDGRSVSSVSTVVICREEDCSGFLIMLAVILAGLCMGQTAAMAVTVTWSVTMKWWIDAVSR